MASDPYFLDRKDAGSKLIPFIDHHINFNTLIIAIPRGGVSVAEPIAEHFKLPIHLLMIKKISHPDNKELAIGACGLTEYVLDDQGLLNEKELEVTISSIRKKLESRQKKLSTNTFPVDLSSKTALLIDDGAATGQTLLCAIRELRKLHPERIVLAVPVASSDAESLLKSEVDDFICPQVKEYLYAIGAFYGDFRQVTDEEVLELLKMNSAFTE